MHGICHILDFYGFTVIGIYKCFDVFRIGFVFCLIRRFGALCTEEAGKQVEHTAVGFQALFRSSNGKKLFSGKLVFSVTINLSGPGIRYFNACKNHAADREDTPECHSD